MTDSQEALLVNDGASNGQQHPFMKPNRMQFWLLVVLCSAFLLVGDTAAVISGRFYYSNGGKSKWLACLVQTVGFPILFVPYFFISTPKQQHSQVSGFSPSIINITVIYVVIGALSAGDNMLYSIGLSHLSASTYALVCATKLAFSAIFSFFLNGQKFTILILNSVVVLSLSVSLLALNNDSNTDKPLGHSKLGYVTGFIAALCAAALYALLLSLMQLSFQRVVKKQTFSVVLDMQIFVSLVASAVAVAGLFASGDSKTLQGEMDSFSTGKVSYVMTLACTAISWQICAVGTLGLIFMVSSLFSNVLGTLSLAITPIASVIIFHDKMNGVKIIAMLMAFWGFITYIYQTYLDDDVEARTPKSHLDGDDAHNKYSSC